MRLITRLWASSHNTIHRGAKSIARIRAYRFVRIRNVRWRAIAMTGHCHGGEYLSDELVGHVLVEQIGLGVDEHPARRTPT